MLLPVRKSLAKLALAVLGVAVLMLPACIGGSGSGVSTSGAFGITVCSLGCGGSSFAVSTWQANKDIIFTFTRDVDPATVDFSSISIVKIADGSAPLGSFIVDGRDVTFRPAFLETVAGLTFGFEDGVNYRITVATIGPNIVRSTNGTANQSRLTGILKIDGIADLVPGPPSVISVDPSVENPPTTNLFNITIVFGDLLRTSQLADPVTGASGLISVAVSDAQTGVSSAVPGTFRAFSDRDSLTTTVIFTPLIGFPAGSNGRRTCLVSLSQQIVDLVGNPLANAGTLTIPLPEGSTTTGSILESFANQSKEDASGSTLGLWAGALGGGIDSGQDPLTGNHLGGGSGVLGDLVVEDGQVFFNTDGGSVFSDLLNETVTVADGAFPFTRIWTDTDVFVTAAGSRPLRLFTRGSMTIGAQMSFNGEDAPPNWGKCFPINEQEVPESLINAFNEGSEPRNTIAGGGDPGTGSLSGGSGGIGGMSWYAGNSGMGPEIGGSQFYLDTLNCGWAQVENGSCTILQPNRFRDTYIGGDYCGANGDRVGGAPAEGGPGTTPLANLIGEDLDAGSGMGSWCWPPKSNVITDPLLAGGTRISSHVIFSGGSPVGRQNHARHRSRGGGGGGYWTAGGRGEYFVPGSTDPLGVPIALVDQPLVITANGIYEYNDDGFGADYIPWDGRAGVNSRPVQDAGGGAYVIPVGTETLNPDLGLLLGGSGGGGAGNNQHGSWKENPTLGNGDIDTFRGADGAGGGAGGGAVQLHSGSDLSLTGSLSANGGDGGSSEFMLSVPWADVNAITVGTPGDGGGGGGSGGAVLVQANGAMTLGADSISVAGGAGGLGSAGNHGGTGGTGLVRIEGPTPWNLAQAQAAVTPNAAVELTPIGAPGQPNTGTVTVNWSGTTADVLAADGTVFNGNSSGVRSRWYEAPNSISQFLITRWEIECEYRDGSGIHSLIYSSDGTLTDPETTAVWLALQAAWMQPGESAKPDPELIVSTTWIVPGFRTVTNGIDQLGLVLSRAVRYVLVFDQDMINALMGGAANGYFKVKMVTFEWEGS
ncbi:MAG: Ig-like domain-containing protein [Planctomycetota bacterium]|nr:Ig-like domain-containing protein [Planctomycetota bacterium]